MFNLINGLKIRRQHPVFHVVRRYGPVGGMERYVWELTLQLQQMGYPVAVLCERCHVEKPPGIMVYELGEVLPRPRWIAATRFAYRVATWFKNHPQPSALIHSHERIYSHQITTFHGSSFRTVFEKPWWQLISLRVVMQLFLERRELKNARYIVPNSRQTQEQLLHYYPEYADKLLAPILPGVALDAPKRQHHLVPASGGVVGFVGTEWKRKGLVLAVEVVRQLRLTRPDIRLVVIGPAAAEVGHLFAAWDGGYELRGQTARIDFTEFDVLLHPAKMEPYGMVISEAMAARVPVVFSDRCGADISTTPDSGAVLPLTAPVEVWVAALEAQLSRTQLAPFYQRGWHEVAQEYEMIGKYLELNLSEQSNATAHAGANPFVLTHLVH